MDDGNWYLFRITNTEEESPSIDAFRYPEQDHGKIPHLPPSRNQSIQSTILPPKEMVLVSPNDHPPSNRILLPRMENLSLQPPRRPPGSLLLSNCSVTQGYTFSVERTDPAHSNSISTNNSPSRSLWHVRRRSANARRFSGSILGDLCPEWS